jgi:hypothetical protein
VSDPADLTRRRVIGAGLVALGSAIVAPAVLAQQPGNARRLEERSVTVEALGFEGFSILDPARRQFGKLTFLGGLELRSNDASFGGISSGVIDADGRRFVAVSDHAHWITGRFIEADGRLSGVDDVRILPMTAPNGRRMKETRWFDSEGLTRIGNRYFVSVERTHDILAFESANGRPAGRGSFIGVPQEMKRLTANQGIEALGVMPTKSMAAGALIAIAERAAEGSQNEDIPGWLLSGSVSGQFTVKRKNNFDITDLAFLPGGDMLILERRFAPFSGIAFRIRRIALPTITPGAVLDGETLIEADMSQQIDNMEALMLHKDAAGRVILTLVSDNNFSLLQRNLVLRFAYQE